MPRSPATPKTRLGQALQARRGQHSGHSAADAMGVSVTTYYRLESGDRRPGTATAQALAAWLGWSLEQVLNAADAEPGDAPFEIILPLSSTPDERR